MKAKHYSHTYAGILIDPYRILDVYGITHPAQQHAIKKLLRAGRSVKTLDEDISEVIDALQRWRQMLIEDPNRPTIKEAETLNETKTAAACPSCNDCDC